MASLLTRRLRGDPDPDEFDAEALSDANEQAVDDFGQAPGADREPRGRTTPAPPPRAPEPVPSNPVAQARPRGPEQDFQSPPVVNMRPSALERATNGEVSNKPPAQADAVPTPYGAAPFAPRSTPASGPYDLGLSGPMSGALASYGQDLKAAQDRAAKLRLLAGLARGGDTINRALTRQAPAPSESAAMLENEGEAGVRDVLARAGLQRQQAQEQRAGSADLLRVTAAAHQARLRDPNSPESVTARQAFAATPAGARISAALGAGFQNTPAAQLPGMGQLLTSDVRGERFDLMQREQDPSSEESQNARASIKALLAQYPDIAARFGPAIEKASAAEIHSRYLPMFGQQVADAARSVEAQKNRDAQAARARDAAARADARAASHAQAAKEKTAAGERKFNVPGLERVTDESGSPVVEPDTKSVDELRKSEANHAHLINQLDTLQGLVSKYGQQPLPTDAQGQMRSIMAGLGPVLYHQAGLNRFNSDELKVLQSQIDDPTSVRAFLNPRFNAMLQMFRASSQSEQDQNRRVLGYRPSGQSPTVKVRKGSETLSIPRADLPAAQADGYALVQ